MFKNNLYVILIWGVFITSIPMGKVWAQSPRQYLRDMLHQPYPQKVDNIHQLYAHVTDITDSVKAYNTLDQLAAIADKADDQELLLEIDLLRSYYREQHSGLPVDKEVQLMETVAEKAAAKQLWHIQVRAVKVISRIYWQEQMYEKGFETFFRVKNIMDRMPVGSFPDRAEFLMIIGEAYYYFQDYQQAVRYFEEAVSQPQSDFNALDIMRSRNNLGLCYRHLNQLDKSDYYFNQIINNRESKGWSTWEGIASGNLGYNFYLRKQYQQATPLLQYDLQKAIATSDYGLAVGALTPLADIRITQGHLQKAGEHIRLARKYVDHSGQKERLRLLYPVISKWHAARGENEQASAYVDSTTQAIEAYQKEFSALKLMRARQKNDLQRRKILVAEKQQQLQKRNLIIIIVILLFIGSLAAYLFRNRYLLRKKEIKELELNKAAQELEHAQLRLRNFAKRVKENDKLIARLQNKGNGVAPPPEVLQEIRSSSLLTDEDWMQFKQLFEQVHTGYIRRLKETYPALTPSQVRFMVLAKLQFSRTEMANILGISPESLRVTWYRIRKRLKLTKNIGATELAKKV